MAATTAVAPRSAGEHRGVRPHPRDRDVLDAADALAYGVVALWSYLLLMTITLLAADSVRWSPFWVTIGIIFVVERVVTAWAGGWRARLLAAPIFLELAYALFLQICFVTSIVQIATGRKAGWNYVPRNPVNGLLLLPTGSCCRRRSWPPTGTKHSRSGSASTPSSSPS